MPAVVKYPAAAVVSQFEILAVDPSECEIGALQDTNPPKSRLTPISTTQIA
jgi:hypothetical protein